MKTIIIVGPTATGKTALAIALATFLLKRQEALGVTILSADSKQVYVGQDVVTGKDKEKFANLDPRIEVHGIDEVHPDVEWSLAHFLKLAEKTVSEVRLKQHVLLVVGGTGQYVSALLSPIDTVVVPRNEKLRQELDQLSVSDLQARLKQVDADKLASMNESDSHNPRRLVRAIEVAGAVNSLRTNKHPVIENPLIIGLSLDRAEIEMRIRKRVIYRLEHGAVEETEKLRKLYPDWTAEAQAAIGYSEIEEMLDGKLNEADLISLWSTHEVQYAKRQVLWLAKKLQPIEWFDAADSQLEVEVEARVNDWYTKY